MQQERATVQASLWIIRVIVGVIFVAHGAQKLFGAWGGPGLAGVVGMMGPVGYLVSVGEFFGGLGMILGFLTRFSAASNTVIMLGAIALVHGKNGFFSSDSGFEYNLALIGLLLPLVLCGPGAWSVAAFLWPERQGGRAPAATFLE